MANITGRVLSGAVNGRGIKIAGTTSGALATIHTSTSLAGGAQFDEVYLWAGNIATTGKALSLYLGGTTSGERLKYTVPPQDGMYLLIPGLRYNNSVKVRAFAGSACVVTVHGYVNRSA